jgi:hypothetical protein
MDPPVMHLYESIALFRESPVMRRHEQCHTLCGCDIKQKLEDRGAGLFIEGTSGLVGEQDFRVVHQRAAEGSALAFAARELLNSLTETVSEADPFCKLMEASLCCAAVGSGSDRRNEAVLFESEIGNEIVKLEDEPDFVSQKQ